MKTKRNLTGAALMLGVAMTSVAAADQPVVHYRSQVIDGVKVAYREAGPQEAPGVLLLHGFPTSSFMFRNLIPQLADRYHVIAPDYPGFGYSDAPNHKEFEYSFDNLARIIGKLVEEVRLDNYTIYIQDYGAPVGLRLATAHPERVTGLIVQNGNIYAEGIQNKSWDLIKAYWREPNQTNRDAIRDALLVPQATKWQYTHGVRDVSKISPDTWHLDQALLDRPGNNDIQLDLFLSYGTNPPLYPAWQAYLREHQPPALVVWGKNDQVFPAAGAHPYRRDLKNVEFHLLDTGHFALEDHGSEIATLIRQFLAKNAR